MRAVVYGHECQHQQPATFASSFALQFAYDALSSSAICNIIFAQTGCILQAAPRRAAGVAKTSLISGRAHVNLAGL
jgi:hypothetical protein